MSDEPARPRPTFAEGFPREPALDTLIEAFARGDYRRVRSEAPELERTSLDPEVRRAARTLLERTHADPLATWLVVLAAILLAIVGGYWALRGKPSPASNPPSRPVEHVR